MFNMYLKNILYASHYRMFETINVVKNKRIFDGKHFLSCLSSHRTVAVNLSYNIFKPEQHHISCTPIIILHGLLGSKQNWRNLGKLIAKKRKTQVYTLDARNHGDSPHTDEISYQLMSEDVKNFMKSQGISSATLIGHSMGGKTAMYLALTENDLVSKLVVVDISPAAAQSTSSPISGYMSAMNEAIHTVPKLGLAQARKYIDDYISKTVPEAGIRQFLVTNLAEKDKALVWKPNLDVLQKNFESEIMDFPSVSGHYSQETLFICGGNSSYVKSEDYQDIRSLFPKAEFAVIPGAGHWVHSEKPADFLKVLCDFL